MLKKKKNLFLSLTKDVDLDKFSISNDLLNNFSDEFADFIKNHEYACKVQDKLKVNTIHVDELASKIATFYEQIRRIIDWKEEHLVRRTAIERILKRRLFGEISGFQIENSLDPIKLAEPIVLEVIRSGYFDNDSIPKQKIKDVANLLSKYIYLLEKNKSKNLFSIKERINFYNWLIEIASCELEAILDPPLEQMNIINFMTYFIFNRLDLKPKDLVSDEDALIQIYVGVHIKLFNLDDSFITFSLIKYFYPQWLKPTQQDLELLSSKIFEIREHIDEVLNFKLRSKFYRLVDKYDPLFRVIFDLFSKTECNMSLLAYILSDKKTLKKAIKLIYDERMQTLRGRLFRSAIYSTLSIFVSGIVSFIIFEGPVASLVGESFSFKSLLFDLGVPSFIMFVLVSLIKLPDKDNFEKLFSEITKVIYKQDEKQIYEVDLEKKIPFILNVLFVLFSIFTGSLASYVIYLLFKLGKVPWTSAYVDTVNVAMIIAAAMVIRNKAQELTVKEKGSFLNFIVEVFSVPLAEIGNWFSEKWREYNIASVFFTALVDTPFSGLISFIESWNTFLKDRSSEIK